MSLWTAVVVKCLPEQTEAVAMILAECGACGTEIDDTEVVFDESEDATLAVRARPQVRGYFECPPATAGAAALLAEVRQQLAEGLVDGAALEVAIDAVADEEWSTSWRQNFPPLEIGRFVIVPTWEEAPPVESDLIAIRLDPGLAFGTGQHPTTYLCLCALGDEVPKLPRAARILDVGCGSGILSIAAALLGAETGVGVVAGDLDAFCTAATQENAALNNVEVEVVLVAGATFTEEQFDLVVANLMSDLLIRLAPELWARLKPGGRLIVSGISAPRSAEVAAALRGVGFVGLQETQRDGERRGDMTERWAAYTGERPAAAQ